MDEYLRDLGMYHYITLSHYLAELGFSALTFRYTKKDETRYTII